jgi:sigma-70-like protein
VKRRRTSGAIRFALWAPRLWSASLRARWSDSEPAGLPESAANRWRGDWSVQEPGGPPWPRVTLWNHWRDPTTPVDELEASSDRDGDIDAERRYFHQIGRVPLLKPREEYALCQQIEAARSAVAAALLATPEGAGRIEQASALRSGADDVESLLLSPGGRPLHKAQIADGLNHLTQAIREGAALIRVDQALDRSRKAGKAPRTADAVYACGSGSTTCTS